MKVVTTFYPPSSVSTSVKCHLDPNSDDGHLVVAKANQILVYSLNPEGLKHECALEIWGHVLVLRAIPVEGSRSSNILVLTDHPEPQLIILALSRSNESYSLISKGQISLYDRHASQAEFCTDIALHPSGHLAVVSCYKGKLTVVSFKKGSFDDHFDVTVQELNLFAMTFLDTISSEHILALLHVDHQQRTQLISRTLDIPSLELSPSLSPVLPNSVIPPNTFPTVDPSPSLITIPAVCSSSEDGMGTQSVHPGGVLVLGGRKLLFFEMATEDRQQFKREKQSRLEKRKASTSITDNHIAREKEKERESRRVKPKASLKWPWSDITTWCAIEADMRKILLCDRFGHLSLLTFGTAARLLVLPIGEVSPATSLVYLGSGVVFVGSHLGNSQLVRVHPSAIGSIQSDTLTIPDRIETVGPNYLLHGEDEDDKMGLDSSKNMHGLVVKTKGTHVEVLETFPNIAPVVDAVSADVDGSGQPQIVTCSGGGNTGSLNFVRTGADFNEFATLKEINNVTKIWPIRSRFENSNSVDSHLLVNTSCNSYLFRVEGVNTFHCMDPSAAGFTISVPTLALSNVAKRVTKTVAGRTTSSYGNSSLIVQVTSQSVNVLEFDEGLGLFNAVGVPWTPQGHDPVWSGREIVAATVNASQIVLGLSGGRLALLNLNEANQLQLIKFKDFASSASQAKEVCALSCAPFDASKHFATFIVLSFWGESAITVLSLEKASDYMNALITIPLPSLASSILMFNFGVGRKSKDEDYHPHVLAGLLDGTVVSFSFKKGELKDKRVHPLGTLPVSLSSCVVDGRRSVFATGSRSAIFYWDKNRLHQSHILLKGITVGVSINTTSFPSCLALASSSSVSFGQIRGVDKTQLRSIALGLETPTHIGYHTNSKQFGVACLKVTPGRVGDLETFGSTFSLFDGNTINRSNKFPCEADEEITSVQPLELSLPEMTADTNAVFCVGTVHHQIGEHEPSAGRILILIGNNDETSATRSNSQVKLVTSKRTDGCVYALDVSDDMIIAGINSSVVIYRAKTSGHTTIIEEISRWNHNYLVTNIACKDNIIAVGDAISSVSLLRLERDGLRTIARDYESLHPIALDLTNTHDMVGATTYGDLFTFSLDSSNTPPVLEQRGSYHCGEVVNRFLHGGIAYQDPHDDPMFHPEHLFFTSSGRIGLISNVDDTTALKLTALERNMANVIKGPGTTNHRRWHTPRKSRRKGDLEAAFGFLDGDFLEQFSTYPDKARLLRGENDAEKIAFDRIELENILEKLQSLH